jgi:ferric-dicitrate binding protein FerR (iron transport regulator)
MARLGHVRRHTTFAAIISLATAALLSPVALMSAWVHAESLPMQVYSTAVGEIRPIVLDEWMSARAARFSVRVRDLKNMDLLVSKGQVTVGTKGAN